MIDVFTGIGVPESDARTCADVLITADKRGIDSHGIGRLKPIYYDRIVHDRIQQPVTELEVVRDHMATAVVDGHDGMGMVIATRMPKIRPNVSTGIIVIVSPARIVPGMRPPRAIINPR